MPHLLSSQLVAFLYTTSINVQLVLYPGTDFAHYLKGVVGFTSCLCVIPSSVGKIPES